MATIYGTSAEDVLRGTRGADTIYGLAGDDTVYAKGGNDVVYGGLNGDKINGGVGSDVLFGGGGGDEMVGGFGNDRLVGNWGADLFYDGYGADTMLGGAGDDYFRATNDHVRDVFDGGAGVDTLTIGMSNRDPLWIRANMQLGTLRIGSDVRDTISSIENITTGGGDDAVNGSASANRIDVGDGNNVVYSGNGDDTILGGGIVRGGRGELLNGGAGDDFIDAGVSTYRGEIAEQTVAGGDGDDILGVGVSLATLSGGSGNDEFWFETSMVGPEQDYTAVQATIVDYQAGELIGINPLHLGGDLVFVGETRSLNDLEVGYHREGPDTVIEANTGAAHDLTIRLAGYTGPIEAGDFVLTLNSGPFDLG